MSIVIDVDDPLVEQLVAWLRVGYLVTLDLEVEAAGVAALFGVRESTLRTWRAEHAGPPGWRVYRGRAWYSVPELADWIAGSPTVPSLEIPALSAIVQP